MSEPTDSLPDRPPKPVKDRLKGKLRFGVRVVAENLARAGRAPLKERVELTSISPSGRDRAQALNSRPKFFILGYPRSGTTLLARLVRLHPEVCCHWQAHFVSQEHSLISALATRELQAWLERPDNRWAGEEQSLASLVRAVGDFVLESQAEAQDLRFVGDKSPSSEWRYEVRDLANVYPDATVIHIVRDGRDVAVSRRLQQFIDQPELLGREGRRIRARLRGEGSAYLDRGRSIFRTTWLAQEAWNWAQEALTLERRGHELYGERYLALRYEDVLQAPVEQMKRVWRHLGVDSASLTAELEAEVEREMGRNPAASWHEQADPELAKAFERGRHGGWREVFTAEDGRTYSKYARRALLDWEYEVS